MSDSLRANVSKFAAYKAHKATQEIRQEMQNTGSITDSKNIFNAYNRYQAAEYNTTISRCRTAKQWQEFQENADILPNLRWLPSRSVEKRPEHQKFYNRVWAKSDDFWKENQPGNLWNCKCDWEETFDDVTENADLKDFKSGQKGLKGNPGANGEVFTKDASYYKDNSHQLEKYMSNFKIKDSKSDMLINILADASELKDNIKTGRILLQNPEIKTLEIRPHFSQYDTIKNPEYLINGLIADAKRIDSENGVKAGFRKAIIQNCKIVIIDIDFTLKKDVLLSNIVNRYADFQNGDINSCIIVYDNKSFIIDASFFNGYTYSKKNKIDMITRLTSLM